MSKVTNKTEKIVIIGAGAAGIASATKLLESGFKNVLILEAENRIGGRIHTIPFGDNVVDLGAQWCHGELGNVVYEKVHNLNMLESTGAIYEEYKCIRSNKEVLSDEVSNALKEIVFGAISERQTELVGYKGSLGSYLTDKFFKVLLHKQPQIDRTIAREFFENFKKFENSIEASDNLFEVSGQGYLEYWTCDGDLLLNWKNKGFKSFLHVLMQSSSDTDCLGVLHDRILFNCRVERIQWNSDYSSSPVIITCCNGEQIKTDHVICTVSLGVLKENHERMFSPRLPAKKCLAIDGLKLGNVNKFFMEFAESFGPPDWSGFSFLWLEEDIQEIRNTKLFWLESVFGFYRVSYQPRLLGGWIIGQHGRYMETLPDKEVLSGLLWLFGKFLNFHIPEPVNFKRTQWYSNPNFRGTYTFRSMYTDELQTGAWDLAAPLTNAFGKPVLQFAGESTSTHFYSTVHGAVESGWREADRLIDYYAGMLSHL